MSPKNRKKVMMGRAKRSTLAYVPPILSLRRDDPFDQLLRSAGPSSRNIFESSSEKEVTPTLSSFPDGTNNRISPKIDASALEKKTRLSPPKLNLEVANEFIVQETATTLGSPMTEYEKAICSKAMYFSPILARAGSDPMASSTPSLRPPWENEVNVEINESPIFGRRAKLDFNQTIKLAEHIQMKKKTKKKKRKCILANRYLLLAHKHKTKQSQNSIPDLSDSMKSLKIKSKFISDSEEEKSQESVEKSLENFNFVRRRQNVVVQDSSGSYHESERFSSFKSAEKSAKVAEESEESEMQSSSDDSFSSPRSSQIEKFPVSLERRHRRASNLNEKCRNDVSPVDSDDSSGSSPLSKRRSPRRFTRLISNLNVIQEADNVHLEVETTKTERRMERSPRRSKRSNHEEENPYNGDISDVSPHDENRSRDYISRVSRRTRLRSNLNAIEETDIYHSALDNDISSDSFSRRTRKSRRSNLNAIEESENDEFESDDSSSSLERHTNDRSFISELNLIEESVDSFKVDDLPSYAAKYRRSRIAKSPSDLKVIVELDDFQESIAKIDGKQDVPVQSRQKSKSVECHSSELQNSKSKVDSSKIMDVGSPVVQRRQNSKPSHVDGSKSMDVGSPVLQRRQNSKPVTSNSMDVGSPVQRRNSKSQVDSSKSVDVGSPVERRQNSRPSTAGSSSMDVGSPVQRLSPKTSQVKPDDSFSLDVGTTETRQKSSSSEDSEEDTFQMDFPVKHFVFPAGKKYRRSISIIKHIDEDIPHFVPKGRNYEHSVAQVIQLQSTGEESNVSSVEVKKTLSIRRLSLIKQDSPPRRKTTRVFSVKESLMSSPVSVIAKNLSVLSGLSSLKGLQKGKSSLNKEKYAEGVFTLCQQTEATEFDDVFNEECQGCCKLGEGVFGEVFLISRNEQKNVMKIMPIEGDLQINGEPQKKYSEIFSELMISIMLNDLRNKIENYTTMNFVEVISAKVVCGKYPKELVKLWTDYDHEKGSDNDNVSVFGENQLYIALELGNGGEDLETYSFSTARQALSIFQQTAFSLAVAEQCLQFEHRDLHWGNILILRTPEKKMRYVIDGKEFFVATSGVKATIIDCTLSRAFLAEEETPFFYDLGKDPELFMGTGDYQFEIYRQMKLAVEDDWSSYNPKTNVLWLHYVVDKMINEVNYKRKVAKIHKDSLKTLMKIESSILECKNSYEVALKTF